MIPTASQRILAKLSLRRRKFVNPSDTVIYCYAPGGSMRFGIRDTRANLETSRGRCIPPPPLSISTTATTFHFNHRFGESILRRRPNGRQAQTPLPRKRLSICQRFAVSTEDFAWQARYPTTRHALALHFGNDFSQSFLEIVARLEFRARDHQGSTRTPRCRPPSPTSAKPAPR